MAVNGRLLTVDDREDLWAAGWEQLPREKAAATLLIFNDRKATLDSLHQFLHAPRKAPVKDAIKCIVAKEIRIDLPHLIQTLSDCKDATSLILEKNEIRSDGMAQLVDALQFRNTLEVLSLKRNFIGDKGASALGEMMAKWKCRKLHTLCLSYCNIGGQGFEGLCMGLSRMPTVLSLTSLDLSANFCKVDGCKALAPLIMDHRKLNYLNLSNNCLEDDGVKVLAASIAHSDVLETLYLEGNHITNAGVRSLCDGLKNNCGLTALGLSCNEIDHHGAMYISQALRGNTRLTSLDLSHNAVGDVGSEFMAGMIRSVSTLKELHLVDNAVGDVGGKYIQLAYEKNKIRSDGMAQLVDALQFRNTLEVLSLKRNFIGDKGASALGEMMAKWKCRKLHTLCLSYCNIGGQGFEGLCMGLSRMPTVLSLTSLDLSANFCKVDGCKALAPLIMDHRKLNYLNLSNNCLEDDGVKVLAASIAHSDVLETLYLEGNHITNAGVRSLCDGLKNNCGLTALGLSCNEIDHHGAMYISQALRGNTRLTSLDLSHNAVGDVGSEFMAGMIRSVSTLKELHLVDNAVGDVGGKYIQLAYEKNTTLMLLDLDMNKMQDKQHEALASAMRTRGHIGILRVGCHAYGNLRPENKFLELAKAQIEQEEAEKENELKPQTPSLSSRGTSRGTSSKPGLDTGNVKLVVKKKEEAPQPTGPIGVLFKKWSGAGAGQKGSKKAKSVDFKEFTEMLKAFKLMPGKIGRHKA